MEPGEPETDRLPKGTLMGVDGGLLGAHYLAPSAIQPGGKHRGWDVWADTGTKVYALLDFEVLEVRDFGSVSGFFQSITVWHPAIGKAVQHGHIKAGVSRMWKAGDKGKRGDLLCLVGTWEDSMKSTPHTHTEIYTSKEAALAFDHFRVVNPAEWRGKDRLNESTAIRRAPGWAGTATIAEEGNPLNVNRWDLPCGCG